MKKILIAFCLALVFTQNQAQEVALIPQPEKLTLGTGNFSISPKTKIVLAGSGLEQSAKFLNDYFQTFFGFKLAIQKSGDFKNNIVLNYEKMEYPIPGAYNLHINKEGVHIGGDNATGTFYGVQTLIQLLPVVKSNNLVVPAVEIEDRPRFGYRGLMLDVGRHFFPLDYVKKFIDFVAMHKMNTMQLHLTEDQGWRIEIKKYPKLTSVGAYRNGTILGHHPGTGNDNTRYGGFYTQQEIKEMVKYAADRFVTIIPEIEMPGHASAAIAAYPQLSCFPDSSTKHPAKVTWAGSEQGKQVQQAWGIYPDVFAPTEYTFQFLQDVLDEILPLFPSKYIHIGGDECPKDAWKKSAFCQQLIKDKNLKDEHGLQSYFIQRMEKYLNSKGRQIIGWDEILEGGLAPNAAVMSWRGEKGGIAAAKEKHQVIMTPTGWAYFDYSQTKKEDSLTIGGYLTVQKVYSYEPLPKELAADEVKYVMGAQANLWTEYIGNPRKLEYMLFPRLSAMSEVLWSPKASKDWNSFEKRLQTQFKRYDFWNWNHSNAVFDPAAKAVEKL
ncbi:MAG: beta-N-acetylhexosaminidase [Chitinophagaceae bacterium BSSC1]|nr:MAG: beta-N-acetylhexosaminidase [Chitinophagaceae bacterium BSSC1]